MSLGSWIARAFSPLYVSQLSAVSVVPTYSRPVLPGSRVTALTVLWSYINQLQVGTTLDDISQTHSPVTTFTSEIIGWKAVSPLDSAGALRAVTMLTFRNIQCRAMLGQREVRLCFVHVHRL